MKKPNDGIVSGMVSYDLRVKGDRSITEDWPFGDLCADGGEWDDFVPVHSPPAPTAQHRGLELLLEVAV